MAKAYLTTAQKARAKQNYLYSMIETRKVLKQIKWSEVAAELGESKQTFKYRFDKRLLEGWELLTLINMMEIKAEELREFMI